MEEEQVMLRKAWLIGGLLILVIVAVGLAASPALAAGGKNCSAERGQLLIDAAEYDRAVREFTCVILAQPTGVEGYRGRIEARLLLGEFSAAFGDYALVTAMVLPVHPDAASTILSGYAARLAETPDEIPALTGLSFAHWWLFGYAAAINVLNDLLAIRPDDVYGNLFRGSSAMLKGGLQAQAAEDLERAILLAPASPDVHYIVADAYLYGAGDHARAFEEATIALEGGLDTPRVNAILAGFHLAEGEPGAAAAYLARHIELVTIEYAPAAPLAAGGTLNLDLVPGRTCEIPVPAVAGQTLAIQTRSNDYFDTIAVLLAPDGMPVTGGDDFMQYYAGFQWTAEETGTYVLQATFFEAVNTGTIKVTRK
jgi:tetratricopeptide (TPR) repeat protein